MLYNSIMKALLVAAMASESQDIIASFHMQEKGKLANFYPFYSATKNNNEIFLVQTHVGSIHAPTAVALAIETIKPNSVIKVGCIGGNASGLKSNDIIVPTLFFHSGNWITRSFKDNQPTNDAGLWQPLYGDKPYQNNRENLGGLDFIFYPDEAITNVYKSILKSENIPYIEAPLGSGDMVIFDHKMMKNIRINILGLKHPNAPWCTDNESYAVALICKIHNIPFTGIYFIASSDYEDIDGYDPVGIRTQTQQTILPIVEKFISAL